MSLNPAEVRSYERYFIDPESGGGVLRPGRAGVACRNIRSALGMLGYTLPYGDSYDEALARAVLQFQTDYGHGSRDGYFGPGTRALLVRQLLERLSPDSFARLEPPVSALVFVSYSREDRERIEPYIEELRRWGFEVWYDKAIPGGATWIKVVQEKVAECDVVVVFLSHAALESRWVEREVAFADAENKRMLPVRLDPGDLGHWGLMFSSSQMLDASAPDFLPELSRSLDLFIRGSG